MRQFAGMVGISNPYMSQIERGLRDPSERVLAEIARNLDVSADALYEQAGMSGAPEDDEDGRRPGRDPRGPAAQRPPAPGAARDLWHVCRPGAPAPAMPRTPPD
jgi:transcriptional regulator with XRE-family HTH domain